MASDMSEPTFQLAHHPLDSTNAQREWPSRESLQALQDYARCLLQHAPQVPNGFPSLQSHKVNLAVIGSPAQLEETPHSFEVDGTYSANKAICDLKRIRENLPSGYDVHARVGAKLKLDLAALSQGHVPSCRALLDTGAEISCIGDNLLSRLGMKWRNLPPELALSPTESIAIIGIVDVEFSIDEVEGLTCKSRLIVLKKDDQVRMPIDILLGRDWLRAVTEFLGQHGALDHDDKD